MSLWPTIIAIHVLFSEITAPLLVIFLNLLQMVVESHADFLRHLFGARLISCLFSGFSLNAAVDVLVVESSHGEAGESFSLRSNINGACPRYCGRQEKLVQNSMFLWSSHCEQRGTNPTRVRRSYCQANQ